MKGLDESDIIKIIQNGIGNKNFVSEDVEQFNIGKRNIIVKVDTLVQSTDIPPKMTLAEAARKSIVACISDFAAKGVKPQFGIISLNLPKTISHSKIVEISRGIKRASDEFQIKILGGDTNEGQEIVFHVCVFGESDRIVPRKGAKSGDIVFATGLFGLTGVGLKSLIYKKKGRKEFVQKCQKAVLKPKPRLEFGLKGRKYFSAAMDSSDGLSTTLNEMAKQSKQKFVIDKIPTPKSVYEFAEQNKIDSMDLIFNTGEEYEFVFTAPKKYRDHIHKLASKLKTPVVQIGYVTKGKGVYLKGDKLVQIKDSGWRHFKK
ncbi:thiamine-phosphate kinase [Nitrosopumilus sp. K4]|uniref:thiamine-phosphate kinase n=1 Tax=Nitrosopumilus sp. K4 TaxID=2795383 RepID=UPI001BAE52EE|nr:thiamine-phosphate kinase [Nitrosopumilus sp. K4]QUC64901.1 thiamine-phosphate kinase [Nitrosopumilus sp. K4]